MFKRIADLNVHYEVQGEGAPLVLLHGGGSRAQTFEEMVPILAKAWRVYTFDMRGFGDTERPPEPKLSYDVWQADLLRFLDAFGLEQVVLGGWSLGGAVALNFTLEYPRRVSQLVIIGAMSPRLEVSDRSGFEQRRALIERGATPAEIVARPSSSPRRPSARTVSSTSPMPSRRCGRSTSATTPATTSRCSRPTKTAPRSAIASTRFAARR